MFCRKPVEERFWEKVETKGPNDCWNWTASTFGKKPHLYGSLNINSKRVKAHRVSYELNKGEIPEGLNVLHSCDNPICVNPNHLFLGTQMDNMKDMDFKKRRIILLGEQKGQAKLKESTITDIRILHATGKYNQHKLAILFDVSQSHIWRIIHRKQWSHVK